MSRTLLNVGRGALPGFLNLDRSPGGDLQWDPALGLPFPDASVDGIALPHLLETLPLGQAVALLRECRRVLVPGGVVRVATRDLDAALERWRETPWLQEPEFQWVRTRSEFLNVVARERGEQWLYDEEELARLGRFVGLEPAGRRAEGESALPELAAAAAEPGALVVELVREARAARPAGDTPLVSVLIPAYNPRYFREALESALAQTYANLEILVSDDRLDDQIERLVKPYLADPRVRYSRNPGGSGGFGYRNALRLFGMAAGEYVKFLNDDDRLRPACVARMVECLNAHPEVTLVTSHRQVIDAAGRPLGDNVSTRQIVREDTLFEGSTLAELVLESGVNFIGEPTTAMFRRADAAAIEESIFSVAGVLLMGIIDTALWVSLLSRGDAIFLADRLSDFRLHAEQGQQRPEVIERCQTSWKKLRAMYPRLGFVAGGERRPLYPRPLRRPAGADPARPGVSIVVLTYKSSSTIERCLTSLVRHCGPQDELILVDNASADDTLRKAQGLVRLFPGAVRCHRSDVNVGFSRGTNLGLAHATRDYVVLLNPDVEVTAGWLEGMVAQLESDPKVGAVGPTSDYVAGLQQVRLYLDPAGLETTEQVAATLAAARRGQAQETKLLIGFCLLTRRDLLARLGNLDPELFLGSDDLDLSLRLRLEGYRLLVATDVFVRHFGHVSFNTEPSIKGEYLTRQATNQLYEKLYALTGGQVPAAMELWDVDWFQPLTGLTSIVVLVHNNLKLTRLCIESVYAHTHRDFELILVDNGSSEDVAGWAAELQRERGNVVYLRNAENQGYAYGSNQGLAAARGEYVVLLNNDVIVTPGWLSKQLALLSLDARIGVVGPRTNYTAGEQIVEGTTYKSIEQMYDFADEWFVEHAGQVGFIPRITGLCMVMRRAVLDAIGGFDTCFGIGNFEDDDLCLRAQRAGFLLAVAHDVFIHHYGSATFRAMNVDYAALMEENFQVFRAKWKFEGTSDQGYPLDRLLKEQAFEPARDHIPADYAEIFHPAAAPLDFGETRPARLLCIPDWKNDDWRRAFTGYVRAFGPEDAVSLVLRVEPGLPEVIEQAVRAAQECLAAAGVPESEVPDIVFEASEVAARDRGGLYTAATALLPVAGSRAHLHAREARACGLPLLESVTREALEAVLAEREGAGAELLAAVPA